MLYKLYNNYINYITNFIKSKDLYMFMKLIEFIDQSKFKVIEQTDNYAIIHRKPKWLIIFKSNNLDLLNLIETMNNQGYSLLIWTDEFHKDLLFKKEGYYGNQKRFN